MRTKTLIAAAAILAVSLATTVAQTNVYSQNVVGYINVTVTNWAMIANQLDLDGTGTNNTVATTLGTNVPVGTAIYAWNPASGSFAYALYTAKGWSGVTAPVNAAMNPGSGFFIKPSSPVTVTLVGNVLQGTLATPYTAGFNVLSSKVPQAGTLQANLGYTPVVGDAVYRFNPATQSYIYHLYTAKGWTGGDPPLSVGDSFWLMAAAAGTWTRNFTVQ